MIRNGAHRVLPLTRLDLTKKVGQIHIYFAQRLRSIIEIGFFCLTTSIVEQFFDTTLFVTAGHKFALVKNILCNSPPPRSFISGGLKKIECCKRKCEWKQCKDRSNACEKNEVITKVTETECQVKPCARVVRCCAIVRREETPTDKVDVPEPVYKPAGKKRVRKPSNKSANSKSKSKLIPRKVPKGVKRPSSKSAKSKKKSKLKPKKPTTILNKNSKRLKSLGSNLLMQPGWYFNKTNDKYLNQKSGNSALTSLQVAVPRFENVENSGEEPTFSVDSALYTIGEVGTVLKAEEEDSTKCVDVAFENSSDMLFASCKGYVCISVLTTTT